MTLFGQTPATSLVFILLPQLSPIRQIACRSLLLRSRFRTSFTPTHSLRRGSNHHEALYSSRSTARSQILFPSSSLSESSSRTPQKSTFEGKSSVRLQTSILKPYAGTPKGVEVLQELFHDRYSDEENDDDDFDWEMEATKAVFPHKLDKFQIDALRALIERKSVVLTAPTGSGKTLTGECAIYLALANGMRVFYTTPLKALSNQKYLDFGRIFGDHRVGLLTGDTTLNRDADIVVMTTEVYRNMLYEESKGKRGELDSVFAVILDEFHYMNSPDRGTVWEESVISSPEHILLVALSATMANAEDIRDWFTNVHGPTALVSSTYRPVPLRFHFADSLKLLPLFASDSNDKRGNSKRQKQSQKQTRKESNGKDRKSKINPRLLGRSQENQIYRREGRNGRPSRGKFEGIPTYPFVVRRLRKKKMLPAIFFVFSRAGCDRAAHATATEREDLVTADEARKLEERLHLYAAQNPEIVDERRIGLAKQGIASHHAGLLPLWKALVEELFQAGLLKVVFATETLAAGINMPAKTTIISALSKRDDEGIRKLRTSEVLQMAGRAGRRGYDVVGYSVIMKGPKEEAFDAFAIVTSEVDRLSSKFAPTYGMVLNLLQTRTIEDARKLIERSFGNFLREKSKRRQLFPSPDQTGQDEKNIDVEKERILGAIMDEAQTTVSSADSAMLLSYSKRLARLKAEQRALDYLCAQREEQWQEIIDDLVAFSPPGTVLLISNSSRKGINEEKDKRMYRRKISRALNDAAESGDRSKLTALYLEDGSDDTEWIDKFVKSDEEGRDTCEAIALLGLRTSGNVELLELVGVAKDGSLRQFTSDYIVKVVDEKVEICCTYDEIMLPPEQEWDSLGPGLRQHASDGSWSETGKFLETLIAEKEGEKSFFQRFEDSEIPEIKAQRMRVESIIDQIRSCELVKDPNFPAIARAMRTVEKLENHPRLKKARRKPSAKKANRAKVNLLPNDDESDDMNSMELFLSILGILQEYGYIDEENNLTDLGKMGAKIRSENELWSSLVLMEESLSTAEPHHFAAVLGATIGVNSRPDTYVGFEPASEVIEICDNLTQVKNTLEARQVGRAVDFDVFLDPSEVGLVEAWARGMSWLDCMSRTSLQEGDVVRRLRRIMDLLRQVPHLPFVSIAMKINAKRAVTLMDRFPVSDDLTYSVRENERFVEYDSDIEIDDLTDAYDSEDDEIDDEDGRVDENDDDEKLTENGHVVDTLAEDDFTQEENQTS